jgi:hypothetical protein
MFEIFKKLGSSGNANYEAAKESVHKDLKIQRLQQEVDDLKTYRKDLVQASMQLIKVKDVAVGALTGIGNQETSGGGQASTMAFHAREALKKIKELEKLE